ncbi:MAG: hypothetical protein ACKVOR_12685 [Flavobacteriales bacterium]
MKKIYPIVVCLAMMLNATPGRLIAQTVRFYVPPVVAMDLDTNVWALPYTTPDYWLANTYHHAGKVVLRNKVNGLTFTISVGYMDTLQFSSEYSFKSMYPPLKEWKDAGTAKAYSEMENSYGGGGKEKLLYIDRHIRHVAIYYRTNCPLYDAAMGEEVRKVLEKVIFVTPQEIDRAAGYPKPTTELTEAVIATRPVPSDPLAKFDPKVWINGHFHDYKHGFTYAAYHDAKLKQVDHRLTKREKEMLAFNIHQGNRGFVLLDSMPGNSSYGYGNVSNTLKFWDEYKGATKLLEMRKYRSRTGLSRGDTHAWNLLRSDSAWNICFAKLNADTLQLVHHRYEQFRWQMEGIYLVKKYYDSFGYANNYQTEQRWLSDDKHLWMLGARHNVPASGLVTEQPTTYYLVDTDNAQGEMAVLEHPTIAQYKYMAVLREDLTAKTTDTTGTDNWWWRGHHAAMVVYSPYEMLGGHEYDLNASRLYHPPSRKDARAMFEAQPYDIIFSSGLIASDLDKDGNTEYFSVLVSNGKVIDLRLCSHISDTPQVQTDMSKWVPLAMQHTLVADMMACTTKGMQGIINADRYKLKEEENETEYASIHDYDYYNNYSYGEPRKKKQPRMKLEVPFNYSDRYFYRSEFIFDIASDSVFLAENMRYPAKEKQAKKGCVVAIPFEVKADGTITNIDTTPGDAATEPFRKEAIRLLKLLGKLKLSPEYERYYGNAGTSPEAEAYKPANPTPNTKLQFILHFIP